MSHISHGCKRSIEFQLITVTMDCQCLLLFSLLLIAYCSQLIVFMVTIMYKMFTPVLFLFLKVSIYLFTSYQKRILEISNRMSNICTRAPISTAKLHQFLTSEMIILSSFLLTVKEDYLFLAPDIVTFTPNVVDVELIKFKMILSIIFGVR